MKNFSGETIYLVGENFEIKSSTSSCNKCSLYVPILSWCSLYKKYLPTYIPSCRGIYYSQNRYNLL